MRMPRPLVVLLGIMYLVSSIGCAAGRWGQPRAGGANSAAPHAAAMPAPQTTSQAMPRRLPHVADDYPMQQASFQASQASPAQPASAGDPLFEVAAHSRPCYEGFEADGGSVVRANYDPYNGPVRDFLISPYGIGLMVVAAIVLPIALDPRERPAGGDPLGGGGGGGGP
jgi:hypothetical protein